MERAAAAACQRIMACIIIPLQVFFHRFTLPYFTCCCRHLLSRHHSSIQNDILTHYFFSFSYLPTCYELLTNRQIEEKYAIEHIDGMLIDITSEKVNEE